MSELQPDPVDMDALTFLEQPAMVVPAAPQSADDVMVPRSYRIPVDLDAWITAGAAGAGQKPSEFVRDMLRLARHVMEREGDRTVSMADVLRALAAVRPYEAA